MKKTLVPAVAILAVALGACGTSAGVTAGPSPALTPSLAPTPSPTVTATRAAVATPTPAPACTAGQGETWVAVNAQANLFGAGLDVAPAPGGGGGGVLPPVVELPGGASRVVTFPCTGGLTNCCADSPNTGPNGDPNQSTIVESFGGIAGLTMDRRAMFLAGVFLSDEAPAAPAPERLDFSGRANYDRIEPGVGQTFFIGDGKGHQVVAPPSATRLFLGFVDGYLFSGKPGWYGNNRGALEATVAITVK